MSPVFADTSFYAACLSPRDAHHAQAIQIASVNKFTVLTTEFLLVELANLFSKLQRRAAAIRLIEQVRNDSDTIIYSATSELLKADSSYTRSDPTRNGRSPTASRSSSWKITA